MAAGPELIYSQQWALDRLRFPSAFRSRNTAHYVRMKAPESEWTIYIPPLGPKGAHRRGAPGLSGLPSLYFVTSSVEAPTGASRAQGSASFCVAHVAPCTVPAVSAASAVYAVMAREGPKCPYTFPRPPRCDFGGGGGLRLGRGSPHARRYLPVPTYTT